MITREHNSYLGLDQIEVAVYDSDPKSAEYLRIDTIPNELTAGKNVIKLFGNAFKFKPGTPVYIETLDSKGNTVYTIMPEYHDSLKRRLIIINVTEETAAGQGLITICSTLNDNLVPAGWEDMINFKWQFQINISPFQSNGTDISFLTPPIVELTTQVKPYVTASFRNNLEMITYEYGDYSYLDFTFEDHVGDSDQSENIFQKNKASTLLNAYANTSITSFDRDNSFYLREENFSARQLMKNYPVINAGEGFYCTLGPNLIQNGIFSGSGTTASYWDLDSGNTYGSTLVVSNVGSYPYSLSFENGAWIIQSIPNLNPGSYYLFMLDSSDVGTFYIELGYDLNRNSGSISENVARNTAFTSAGGTPLNAGHVAILRASNAGNNLFISFNGTLAALSNVRLHEIIPINKPDFTMNSDFVGGYVKVHHPQTDPAIPAGYELYQIDPATKRLVPKTDPGYQSYVDHVLQFKDTATDDRFYYNLIDSREKNNPESQLLQRQKNNRFKGFPQIDQQVIDNNLVDSYVLDSTVVTTPTTYVPLQMTLVDSTIYGVMYDGGGSYRGGIFTYDIETKQINFIRYFSTFAAPTAKLLYTSLPNNRKYLWGTTYFGGRFNSGSIYRLDLSNNSFSTLYHFGTSGSSGRAIPNISGGIGPLGQLYQATDGLLYGVTQFGGENNFNAGVLYSFNTASNQYNKIHDLLGNYGGSNIVQYGNFLYTTIPFGGTFGSGSILKYNLTTKVTQSIISFNGNTDGYRPDNLTLGTDNWIYGLTYTSSIAGVGSVMYKFNPANPASPNLTFQILATLDSVTTGSAGGSAPLFFDGGNIYGVCTEGGLYSSGSVFRYNSASGDFKVLHYFSGSSNGDGEFPKGNFIRIGNSLYSTTTNGGAVNNSGTFFRINRQGIYQPYVSKEAGYVYHHNAVIPEQIPETASLISDYPRWTGPVALGSQFGLFAIVQLELKNLDPLTGDISKLRLSAKQAGLKSDFVDLGVYSTKPVDVLLDPNFVNHVHYNNSPYRLTGYFKPTITQYYDSFTEDPRRKFGLFNSGWVTGSITSSYYIDDAFHKNLKFIDYPATSLPANSVVRLNVTSSYKNGMAYLIYTASSIPPTSSNLNTWQQISYELLSSYPIPNVMETASYNFYTGSSLIDIFGLNNVLAYSALFKNTASITLDDIYAISSDIPTGTFNYTGSSISSSAGEHPYIFHNKLGYKTDDYLITEDIASSGSLYMGILFEYNSSSNAIFGTTASADSPHLLDIANIISREIGDREYMINRYWEWYSRVKEPNTSLVCSASVTSNTTVLMDSAKIMAVSNSYDGAINKNKIVFQTKNDYKFIKGTKYVLAFNAVTKLDTVEKYGCNVVPSLASSNWIGAPRWDGNGWLPPALGGTYTQYYYPPGTKGPNSISYVGRTVARSCANEYINDASQVTNRAGKYKVQIQTGQFEFSNLETPVTIKITWGAATAYITDVKPFTSYETTITLPGDTTANIQISANLAYNRINSFYLLNIAVYPILNETILDETTLTAYAINSEYGAPFRDQLVTTDIGEFIGELVHKRTYNYPPESKNFGRIEMEFEAEVDGYGKIAFEIDAGAEWYLSEISVRPKDRVGLTPGYTRLFVKVPSDLVNIPLTFKIEYLNDYDVKSSYTTILNDITFTNVKGNIAEGKTGLDSSTLPSRNNSDVSIENTGGSLD